MTSAKASSGTTRPGPSRSFSRDAIRTSFGPRRAFPAQVVPADTPFGEQTTPLPATGPYMFERFDADRIKLVRNPLFDRLVRGRTALGLSGRDRVVPRARRLGPVGGRRGRRRRPRGRPTRAGSRTACTCLPRSTRPSFARTRARRSTSRVLNTKVPPFDDPACPVRAQPGDRPTGGARGVGWSETGPDHVPADGPDPAWLRAVLPFHRGSDPSGRVDAPDPGRARSLAQAGAVGEPVIVYGSSGPGHKEVAEYMVGLLDSWASRRS